MKMKIFTTTFAIALLMIPASRAFATTELEYVAQSNSFYDAKNYGAAWAYCNEAIKLNPYQWIYYYFRGDCSANMGNYWAANADYTIALGFPKRNEENGSIHFSMAFACVKINDFNGFEFHLLTAARLGNPEARALCAQNNVSY